MSPGTPAIHHLERYIGSCLISSPPSQGTHRPPGHHYSGPRPSWTGGLPLILRRQNHPQEDRPLSRLALQAEGAPLIQQSRSRPHRGGHHAKAKPPVKPVEAAVKEQAKDASSVVSDESSSGNSENSLPRIIKPRKRRKKDRKPQQPTQQQDSQGTAPSQVEKISPANPVKTYSNLCYEPAKKIIEQQPVRKPDLPRKVPDLSSCACRYCDPIGIWDAPFSSESLFSSPVAPIPRAGPQIVRPVSVPEPTPASPPPTFSLEVSSEIVTSPNGQRDIEIKFFSTPSPPPAVPAAVSMMGPPRPPWASKTFFSCPHEE